MTAFKVCPVCEGNGKRRTKAGKEWFACEMCAGVRVVETSASHLPPAQDHTRCAESAYLTVSEAVRHADAADARATESWARYEAAVERCIALDVDLELRRATLYRLRESVRKHQRALLDLLHDVAEYVAENTTLYDRVTAFMDIEPNDESFEVVSADILDLIERALAGSAQSDHALAADDERRVDDWLREMRRLLP